MSVYLYFCCVCGAAAIALICGAVIDFLLGRKYSGKHERR